MIIGFVIGNLVLSCGTSISVETVSRQRDITTGNPFIQTKVELESGDKNMKSDHVVSFCESLSKYGELYVGWEIIIEWENEPRFQSVDS